MLVDVFYRTYNSDRAKMLSDANVRSVRVEVAAGAGLAEILEAAWRAGASKGSSRSGIFEVQTEAGIWAQLDGGKIDLTTGPGRARAVFRTWDELEAEAA